jgi:hypothetical protein
MIQNLHRYLCFDVGKGIFKQRIPNYGGEGIVKRGFDLHPNQIGVSFFICDGL